MSKNVFPAFVLFAMFSLVGAGCVAQTVTPAPQPDSDMVSAETSSDTIVHDAIRPGKEGEIMAVIAADLETDVELLKYYEATLSSQNERMYVIWGTAAYQNPSAIATFKRVGGEDYELVASFAGGVKGDLNHQHIENVRWENNAETIVGYDAVTVDEGGIHATRKTFMFDATSTGSKQGTGEVSLAAMSVTPIERDADWVLPGNVDPAQVRFGAMSTDPEMVFAYVEQPNSNTPLWRASGSSAFGAAGQTDWASVNFAGVLMSRDGGKTWSESFEIPVYPFDRVYTADGLRPFNPIGMFAEEGKLWLDIVDDNGAGSGEGVLVRYSSSDGISWSRSTDCLYFVPESYFNLSQLPEGATFSYIAPIRPHNLQKFSVIDSQHNACPGYVSELP